MNSYFAVTAPGLEALASRELRALNLIAEAPVTPTPGSDVPLSTDVGGIAFTGDLTALYRANLHLRTASRVLLRLGSFHAKAFPELRKKASRLEWARYLVPGQAVAVRATCHHSKLYHSGAVVERIFGAIADSLGGNVVEQKPGEEETANPPQLVLVRLVDDECTISIDSSGELLHRRGYRQALAKAPLRETLAAAIVLASDWDMSTPFIDPFCGSGVIPIEAALLALGLPPGRHRRFAFMDWPGFNQTHWNAVQADANTPSSREIPPILASDRDAGAIAMAQQNADRAGVLQHIDFRCQAVSALEPPAALGTLVTNPPYGVRLSANKDLRNLYAQFGNVLRSKCMGWHTAILCSDLMLLGQTGLRLDTSFTLVNGGLKVRLGKGVVKAMSQKKKR